MVLDLVNIKRTRVSSVPSSYSMLLYAPTKFGKTTFVNELFGERLLNIMTEKRLVVDNAAGVYISNYAEMLDVIEALKRPETQKAYDAISIDTVENLFSYVDKKVALDFGEDAVGEDSSIGFGRDYTKRTQVWFDLMKELESLPYTLIFVSHELTEEVVVPKRSLTKKDVNSLVGSEELKSGTAVSEYNKKVYTEDMIKYQKYVPDLNKKALGVVSKMVDNIIYGQLLVDENGNEKRVLRLRGTIQYQAGCTLAGVPDTVDFTPEAYRKALEIGLKNYHNKSDVKHFHASIKSKKLDYDKLRKRAALLGSKFNENNDMKSLLSMLDELFKDGTKVTELPPSRVQDLSIAVSKMETLAHEKGYI